MLLRVFYYAKLMYKPQFSPGFYRLPASLVALVFSATAMVAAQSRVRVASGAAFRKAPDGLRLGNLVTGVQYAAGKTRGQWVETILEGWIARESTAQSTREGFDLTITAAGGENLRATPGGVIIARVVGGTLLSRVSARGTWVQVRRRGWVSRGSLLSDAGEPAAQKPAPVAASAPRPSAPIAPPPPPPPPAAGQASAGKPPADSSPHVDSALGASTATGGRVQLRRGSDIAPVREGVPFATFSSKAEALVLGRSRDWVKVRFEGWIKAIDLVGEGNAPPAISAAQIHKDPDKYVGQTVSWRLQFLATQTADELRPEMAAGQMYLLTRGPLPETGFVYVIVPPSQTGAVKGLQPLDEIVVEGLIRAGRTRYLPTPVVEIVKIGSR